MNIEKPQGTTGVALPKNVQAGLLNFSDAALFGIRDDGNVDTQKVAVIQTFSQEFMKTKGFPEELYKRMSRAVSTAFDKRVEADPQFTSFHDVVYGVGRAQVMTSNEVKIDGVALPEGVTAVKFEVELGYKFNPPVEWTGTEDEIEGHAV